MSKEIVRIQLVAFFDNEFSGKYEKVLSRIESRLGGTKSTQILPIPSDAPSDIPRLILNYDSFGINVSKNRADLFTNDFKENRESLLKALKSIKDITRIDFERLGFIKNFFIDGNVETLRDLINNDFSDSLPNEVSIRVNCPKEIEGYKVNNIEDINLGFIEKKKSPSDEPIKKHGILLTRDINTVKDEEYIFTEDQIFDLADKFDEQSESLILIGE